MAATDAPPPLRRSYWRDGLRLAWLGVFVVGVLAILIMANWLGRSSQPEEKAITTRASDTGVQFKPVTVPTAVVPAVVRPPPEPVFDYGAAKATVVPPKAGTLARNSAVFGATAHTASATTADTSSNPASGANQDEREAAGDDALSSALRSSNQGDTAVAHFLPHERVTVAEGSMIPCRLMDRIVTQVPGLVRCETPQRVMGWDGTTVALPKWTRFSGQIRNSVTQGNDRVEIIWTKALTPSPRAIEIKIKSPGVDELGSAGVPGQIDNHVWSKIGALTLYTLLEAGPAIAQTALQNNSRGGNSYNTTNLYSPSQNVLGGWLQQKLNQAPTLVKNQGELINIRVAQNWDFDRVIGVEAIR